MVFGEDGRAQKREAEGPRRAGLELLEPCHRPRAPLQRPRLSRGLRIGGGGGGASIVQSSQNWYKCPFFEVEEGVIPRYGAPNGCMNIRNPHQRPER